MTTYEKIKELCEKEGFAISSLCSKIPNLSVNKASISGWKNGSKPRPDKLKAIADYFGVSVDYFSDDYDDSAPTCTNSHQTVPMDEDEADILRIYRKLSRKSKHEFMAAVYDFEKREELAGDNGSTAAM